MDINTLTSALKTAIAGDSSLTAWCTANYRKHSVWVNMDLTDPPAESSCPYVVIYPVGKQVGEMQSPKRHVFEIVCCLYDAGSTTSGNTTVYTGVANLETMRKYVETAVIGASMGECWVSSLQIEYETIENFPFLLAGMTIEIYEDVCIGGSYLE